jgi:hypothetical protein
LVRGRSLVVRRLVCRAVRSLVRSLVRIPAQSRGAEPEPGLEPG